MKIAVVDDEQNYLDEMVRLCHAFSQKNHCLIETFTFTSGKAFLKALDSSIFSVVFMDIYMEEMDGITTALKLREQINNCILVFLTSSMDFMPDAFSCHAFEYITKPFSAQRIQDVLTDILKILPPSQKYIEISSSRKTVRVFLDDILSILTDAHYLDIQLMDGTVLHSRMTMKEFIECSENDSRFISINKGVTVNADYILDFENNTCILENGSHFPVRVRDRLKIEQEVQDYHFKKIRERQSHPDRQSNTRQHGKEF